jgi:hypothetical protein
MRTATERTSPAPRHARRARFFTAWVATLTVLLGLLFTSVTVLTVALWLIDPSYAETGPVVDLGFFALGGGIVTAGLATQLRSPQRHVAGLQQAILGLLALATAGHLAARIEPFIGSLLLLGAIVPVIILHPSRHRLLAAGKGLSLPLAGLAVAALGPALVYASSMLDHARDAGPSCFLGQCARGDRFAEMAALAIAVSLVGVLAALRTTGWTIPARTAGIAAILLGTTSLALPGEIGGLEPRWAVATLLWGAAFIIGATLEARRSVDDAPRDQRRGAPARRRVA